MKERLSLFYRYLKNKRIEEYENILLMAKDNGYQCISLAMYAEGNYEKDRKVLVLRHDVDHKSGGTQRMFEVEKRFSAYSSFYFRDSKYDESTTDKMLMQDIETYGSEASLHFETVANFGVREYISSREELMKLDFLVLCRDLLREELDAFRVAYDVPCKTIASHGAAFNSMVGVSNNTITENTDTYCNLGIELEAYNEEFINSLGIYISDAPMEINNGYRYGVTVEEAIRQELSPILFLSHPNHWHYSFWKQFRKLVKMILMQPIHSESKFVRIAE